MSYPARAPILVSAMLGALWFAGGSMAEAAQADFPSRPVRLIVPFAPGGGQDLVARTLGAKLGEALGQQIVVDNRPGGGSVVASESVARAPADGYTLYLIEGSFTLAPSLHHKLPFDPLQSFAPIARVSTAPGALVIHPSVPARSVKELLALARKNPGQLSYGSAGVGSSSHLAGELLKMQSGIDMVHVPYKGSSAVTTALLSGEVSVALTNPVSTLPFAQSGRLRMLAVTTRQRVAALPDVPTVAESGISSFENVIWNGIVVRAGTPESTIELLNREIVKAALSPGVKEQITRDGAVIFGEDSPRAFAEFIQGEIVKWSKVVRQAGIKTN